MNPLQRKLKRVAPLRRASEAIVDREMLVLANLRREKQRCVDALQKSQGDYLKGVNELNACRQRPDRHGQLMLEDCVTFARESWVKLYRQVQQVDRQVEAQLSVLQRAENQLKAVEKLEAKYLHAWQIHLGKKEQERIDEHAAIQRHHQRVQEKDV